MSNEESNSMQSLELCDQQMQQTVNHCTAFDWNVFTNRTLALKQLKDKKEFVDVMITGEDGAEEVAHFAVLSALGKTFSDSILRAMNESNTEKVLENGTVVKLISLPSIKKQVLRDVVNCAYTGMITTDMVKIWDLFETAEFYEIKNIIYACLTFFIYHLNIKNCVRLFHLGIKYEHKLANSAWNFIKTYFENVIKECKDFSSLSTRHAIQLIDDDELNVKSETIVWEAIQRLYSSNLDHNVRSQEDLKLLLLKLRYARIGIQFITDTILKSELINENEDSKRLIKQMISDHSNQTKKKDGYGKYVCLEPRSARPRIPHEVMFAIGGWQEGVPTTLIETYDIRTNKWFESKISHDFPRAYHGIQVIDGIIYLIGGTNGSDILNTVQCFNPITMKWYERAHMIEQRCYVSTAFANDLLYVMGGHNGLIRVKSCEVYDPNTNAWSRIESMNMARSDASAAVLNGKIYIAGGLNDQLIENTVEMYNPDDNTWNFVHPMNFPRTSFALVSYHNSLYAIGGNNGLERMQSVERYDMNANAWVHEANMISRRSTFAACVIENQIVAIGGYNGHTPIALVEKYDDTSKEWTAVREINHDRSGLAVCVISGLSNSSQYTYIGHTIKRNENKSKRLLKKFMGEKQNSQTNDEEMTDQSV